MKSLEYVLKKKYKLTNGGLGFYKNGVVSVINDEKILIRKVIYYKTDIINFLKTGEIYDVINRKSKPIKMEVVKPIKIEKPIKAKKDLKKFDIATVKPKYKQHDCEWCGKPLPEKELKMQSFYHYECWLKEVDVMKAELKTRGKKCS